MLPLTARLEIEMKININFVCIFHHSLLSYAEGPTWTVVIATGQVVAVEEGIPREMVLAPPTGHTHLPPPPRQ